MCLLKAFTEVKHLKSSLCSFKIFAPRYANDLCPVASPSSNLECLSHYSVWYFLYRFEIGKWIYQSSSLERDYEYIWKSSLRHLCRAYRWPAANSRIWCLVKYGHTSGDPIQYVLGEEALEIYNTFSLSTAEQKVDVLFQKFEDYCNPRWNITWLSAVTGVSQILYRQRTCSATLFRGGGSRSLYLWVYINCWFRATST